MIITLNRKVKRQHSSFDKMHVDGPATSSLDYTRDWVKRVDRGGLFDVSNETYLLFYWIEDVMRDVLTSHISNSTLLPSEGSEEIKKMIIEAVVFNRDIQFRWSVDISEDSDSTELLTHIVSLWLNIRGFSISKSWMEDYKVKTATTTKAKKSLRKELSKDSNGTTPQSSSKEE